MTELDTAGKRRYECANVPCDARNNTAFRPEKVYGFGDQCRGGGLRLGDRLAWLLHRVGITRARWLRLRAAVGLEKPCGCPQRQERMNHWHVNEVGWWVGLTMPLWRVVGWLLKRLP